MQSRYITSENGKSLIRLLYLSGKRFVRVHGPQHAAATAYFGIFSLFPLTLLLSSVCGILFERDAQEITIELLVNQLQMSDSSVESALKNFLQLGPAVLIASAPALILTSGTMTSSLRKGLDETFGPVRNRSFLRSRLIDYALIPLLALPLIGGFITTALWNLSTSGSNDISVLDIDQYLITPELAIGPLISLALTLLSAMLWYHFVPTRKPAIRTLWFGAIISSLGFEILKYGFTFYISRSITFDLIYGPLTSIMAIMLFIFISAYIFIFGAAVCTQTLRD
jgi:membrane protein